MMKFVFALVFAAACFATSAQGDLAVPQSNFSAAEGGYVQQVGLVSRFFDNAGNYSLKIQGDGTTVELPSTNPKQILEACERHALLAKLTARPFYLKLVQGAVRRCGVN